MRRPIIIFLSVGAALLIVSLGLLMARAPTAIASSGTITHTTYNDFGNSGPNCVVGSNPVLTSTHISDVGGGAVALAGDLDDDFPGSSLNVSLWQTGTWGANPYTLTISNSILTLPATTTTDIDGGWVRSLTGYTPATGSPIVMEATAAFGNGSSQHIGFGTSNTGGFIDKHILFSTYFGDGNLYARVDNSGGTTNTSLGTIPPGMHRYRIEWSQTTVMTDTVTFYIDNVNKIAIDVAHASGFRTYLSNDGPADLKVDVADVAPTYATSGTYSSCVLDAGADNAWQSIGWDPTTPTSTTLTVLARTSFDAVNWSNWATMPVSGTAPGPAYRYAQYQLQLATTDTITTPIISAVNLAFDTGARTLTMSDGGTTQAAIGSVVPYTLTITVPQTSTSNLIITDTLPAGMIYNGDQAVNGISPAPTFSENGNTLTWNFGVGQAVFASSPATITFSSSVANVIGNQLGNTLTHNASMTYSNLGSTAPVSDSFTVTEPLLTVNKVVLTSPSPADAGGTVAYRVTITNPGGANVTAAYDAVFTDVLPSGLVLNSPLTVTLAGGAAGETHSVLNNTATVTVTTIPVGGSAQIDYTAGLNSSVTPSQYISNTGTVAWTSQLGANANERTGAGGVNDYVAQDTVSFAVADPALSKALVSTSLTDTSGSNVTIGEVITYSLPITLPEGTTPLLTVTDTLPSGLAYINGTGSLDASGFNGTVPSPSVTTPGNDVVFSFATPITVAGDNVTTNNRFTLNLQARVLDAPGNQGSPPTNLSNSATLQVDGSPTFNSNAVAATVVEPQLTVTKVVTPTHVVSGDVVTTTVTVTNVGAGTAFDVILDDPLPNTRFFTITSVFTPTGFVFSAPTTTTAHYTGSSISVGGIVTFTFKSTVKSGYALGEVFTNTATITQATTISGVDPNERNEPPATGSTSVVFGLVPDISVSKTDGLTSVTPGQRVTYTLTISNTGLVDAPNVSITDTLPANTTFAFASDGGSQAGGVVTWPMVTTITVGSSVTHTVAVTVTNPIAAGVNQITNTAQATHDGSNGPEPTPSDNTGTDVDTVDAAPDFAISQSDGVTSTTPGNVVVYTLNYTNTGTQNATGVKITETVPANTTFIPGSSSAGWSCVSGACTLTVGALNGGGASGSKTFAVQVVNPLPAGVTTITNTATVGDDNSNGADPTPGNNTTTPDVDTVVAAPDLAIGVNVGSSTSPGSVIVYTLVYSNVGNQGATNVVITETVPTSATFNLANSTPGWSCADGAAAGTTCTFSIGGSVAGGGFSGSVIFAVNVPLSVPAGTVISDTAIIGDDGSNGVDPPGNNTGLGNTTVMYRIYLPIVLKGS